MNQIQQLINQMCPNGVEWKTLGEVCEINKGVQLNKEEMSEVGSYPVINGGILPSGYVEVYNQPQQTITISQGGASAGYVNWLNTKFWAGAHCYVVVPNEKIVCKRFVFHFVKSIEYKLQECQYGAGIPALAKKTIEDFQIPVPPLAIQTRIVEILDHFTNLTANLTAELNLRRKQFEHYREKLLSLDGVEMVKLFDVAKNSTGLTYKPSDVSDSGTLVLRSSNIQNSMLCFDDNVFVKMKSIPTRALVKENDILVCVRNGSSSLIGKAAIIDKSCEGMAFGAFMTILRAFNINYKYLFYVWQSDRIQKMVHGDSGAPINQITNAVLDKIMIPYPSEDTQHSIVSILDKFTALIENIEKELALRQKQYEYYREELLRFGG